jgi:type IV fimbrial biogenesis protein FimU
MRNPLTTRRTRGFTLLELIVSVGLFMIVVTIAASAYLSLISLNRRAQATNDVSSNLAFVMESVSRSIRTGSAYDCGGGGGTLNCWAGGSSTFSFTNEDGQVTTYLRRSNGTVGVCTGATCTDSSASSITDPRISITSLYFYVEGVGYGDGTQPRVLIALSGSITPDPRTAPVTFTIQTSATQRLLEL